MDLEVILSLESSKKPSKRRKQGRKRLKEKLLDGENSARV
jgi:hypothetical protein